MCHGLRRLYSDTTSSAAGGDSQKSSESVVPPIYSTGCIKFALLEPEEAGAEPTPEPIAVRPVLDSPPATPEELALHEERFQKVARHHFLAQIERALAKFDGKGNLTISLRHERDLGKIEWCVEQLNEAGVWRARTKSKLDLVAMRFDHVLVVSKR